MMLFAAPKKPTAKQLETELAEITRRLERLTGKLTAARAELEAASAARLKLLTGGDDEDAKAEKAAQARVLAAQSAREAAEQAVTALEAQCCELQRRLEAERDRAIREECADRIDADIETAEAALEALKALRRLSEAFSTFGHINSECTAISNYAANAAYEIEVAAAFQLDDVRRIARSIADGTRRIPGRPPEPLPVKAEPPMERVFVTQPIAWLNSDGSVHTRGRYHDLDLPPALAQKAIALKAAIPIADPQVRELSKNPLGPLKPDLDRCIPLDDAAAAAKANAGTSSTVVSEPLPGVGEPYTVKIPYEPV